MPKTLFGSSAQPAGLSNLPTEASYGAIWSRSGLSIPECLICAIAACSTGSWLKALRRHLGAGLDPSRWRSSVSPH